MFPKITSLAVILISSFLSGCSVSPKTNDAYIEKTTALERYNSKQSFARNVLTVIHGSKYSSQLKDQKVPKEVLISTGSAGLATSSAFSAYSAVSLGSVSTTPSLGLSVATFLLSGKDRSAYNEMIAFVPVSEHKDAKEAALWLVNELDKGMLYAMSKQSLETAFEAQTTYNASYGKVFIQKRRVVSNEKLGCPNLEKIKNEKLVSHDICETNVSLDAPLNEADEFMPPLPTPKWIDEKETLAWRFHVRPRTTASPLFDKTVDLSKFYADFATQLPRGSFLHVGTHYTLEPAKPIGYKTAIPYVTDGKKVYFYVVSEN